MKKSRYTDSQIINILKQAEAGTPVPELRREHGTSSASFYKWRAKYGGMDASLMGRMKGVLPYVLGSRCDLLFLPIGIGLFCTEQFP